MNPESHHEFHIFSFQSSKWKALQDVDVGAMGRRKSNFYLLKKYFHMTGINLPRTSSNNPRRRTTRGDFILKREISLFLHPFNDFGFVDTLCDVLNEQWNQCAMGKLVISVCIKYISYLTGREFNSTKDNFDKICGHNILLSCKMAILFFRLRFQINDGQRPKWSSPKNSFICCQILCERKWGLGKKRIWPNMKRPRFLTLRKMGWDRSFLHH